MDDVLVGQAAAGTPLGGGEHLRRDRGGGTGLESREARPAWGGGGQRRMWAQHPAWPGRPFTPEAMQQTRATHLPTDLSSNEGRNRVCQLVLLTRAATGYLTPEDGL